MTRIMETRGPLQYFLEQSIIIRGCATNTREALQDFENSQEVSSSLLNMRAREPAAPNALASTSYWFLAEFQPEHCEEIPDQPPDRPPLPCSRQPLWRLMDLILKREQGKVVCALSDKTISMQLVVALASGLAILKECYDMLVKRQIHSRPRK
jgi:hypothetical protein